MRWMPSICALLLAALALCLPAPARASVQPDQPLKFNYVPPSQRTHVCITGNCGSSAHVWTGSGCDAMPLHFDSPQGGRGPGVDEFPLPSASTGSTESTGGYESIFDQSPEAREKRRQYFLEHPEEWDPYLDPFGTPPPGARYDIMGNDLRPSLDNGLAAALTDPVFSYASDLIPVFNPQWHGLNVQFDTPQISVTPSNIFGAQATWPGETGTYSTWSSGSQIRNEQFGSGNPANGDTSFSIPVPHLDSFNFLSDADFSDKVIPGTVREVNIGGQKFYTATVDVAFVGEITALLEPITIGGFETNWCRVVLEPSDPNYLRDSRHGGNSWGARVDDQWAIKRVGFTADDFSAWKQLPEDAEPVVVAIIDTGLDWHHPDISPDNIWRNPNEDPDNGIDDDSNGYVDDVIGWNFMDNSNKPWDFDGHGTIVAGIIGATQDNNEGIAGINPNVKIMVLKAINNFGKTRASYVAEAIVYAVDNGAQVINLSVGGEHSSAMEQAALEFARQNGVVVVAAAGNDGAEITDFGPGGDENVLTVGATHVDDRAAAFSNFGEAVDLVAPGVDVLSLRARGTDASVRPESVDTYTFGDYFVGEDGRYYRASGTSFSTPIVAGVASLVFAKHPEYTAEDVRNILLQTAEDVELPGKDPYGGVGMVDAEAALSVDPNFYITAEITNAEVVDTETGKWVHVYGTIDASEFKRAWMQIGPGENPARWRFHGQKRKYPIKNGLLGKIQAVRFTGSELWQVVINVEHKNGVVRSTSYPFRYQQ